jgi:hypothetical protein
MGILDRLRGGGDLTLGITLEPAEVAPGGEFVLRFDVGGELDDKARGVRVGIRGEGKYLVTETDRDADGDVDTRQVWREIELHEEEHHYPAQLGPGQARFTLPGHAPPSSADAVEWTAFARVDRERGMDKVERRPLDVRQSAEHLPSERAPRRSDDGLTLDDVPTAVRAGETVTGHLTIQLAADTKVTAARIRLHRRCTYLEHPQDGYDKFDAVLDFFSVDGTGSRIVREEKVAEVDLSEKREFAAGAVEQLPFSIVVPDGPGPTTAHPNARVEWRLEAVLDRRMRDDLAVATPLVVY